MAAAAMLVFVINDLLSMVFVVYLKVEFSENFALKDFSYV